ncbi:ABATE domain-containing protein [Actinoallomurus vinaceus]|uniref:ABATE domain-containing protein n=1 Tax=Actinoallomurus vinaceus TaxID=1080074 RepID=A0ABP8UIJ8_9ACTN
MSEDFALMLPDEPVPVRLMNTVWADRAGVHDALRTPDDLCAWLRATGEDACGEVDRRDVETFRSLRDALRRLAALLTEDSRETAASPTEDVEQAAADVNQAVTRATTWPQLSVRDGRLRRSSTGTESVAARSLSAVAAEAVDLFTGPDQERLRACYAPGCVLYFVKDHPRREWCSTACGNRVRAARHYRRHRS